MPKSARSQAANKAKTQLPIKDAIQLLCSALLEKTTDNAVKDYTATDCKKF